VYAFAAASYTGQLKMLLDNSSSNPSAGVAVEASSMTRGGGTVWAGFGAGEGEAPGIPGAGEDPRRSAEEEEDLLAAQACRSATV